MLDELGRYIIQDGEAGVAVYRIAHQTLADHIRPPFAASHQQVFDPQALFRDAQRERRGVVGSERVCDSRNPAWRVPGGVCCSWCRRGAHSAEMTSLMAARAADWSTIFLPVA